METTSGAAMPLAPPFTCRVSMPTARVADVELVGDLDLANSQMLRDELLSILERDLDAMNLDLESLSFLDSSGLAALIVVRKCATEKDIDVRVRSISPTVRRVLQACAVEEVFGLERSS